MASPRVGSPMMSCQWSTGSWLVMMVEPRPWRSSTISSRSRRAGGQGRQPPIVEDEEIDAAEVLSRRAIATVAARERERLEQARHAMIEHGAIVAAGLVSERAGQPAFADAGQAHDILPRNIRSKLSFNIRIIRALVSASWLSGASFTGLALTS